MADKNKVTAYYGKPKDRTFEAYVEFMDAMINAIAPRARRILTEEQRRENWKKFWEKADAAEK